MMEHLQKKPLGIVLTVSFFAFWGLLLLPAGYVTALAKGVRGAPHYAGVYGCICMALGATMLAGAYGLWRMQTWGHSLVIGIVGATLPISVMQLFGLFSGGRISVGAALSSLVCLALALLIARYLSRGYVRQMYKRPSILREDRFVGDQWSTAPRSRRIAVPILVMKKSDQVGTTLPALIE